MSLPGYIRASVLIPLFCSSLLVTGCVFQQKSAGLYNADYPEHDEYVNDRYSIVMKRAVRPQLDKETDFSFPADGRIALSIEQAVMLVLQNNSDLRVRTLNPLIAGTFEKIERGVYDPELFAEMEYNEERGNETSRSTGTQFSVEGNDTSSTVGVRKKFITGTSIEASAGYGRSVSNRSPEQQEARLGLTITQSLLQGFGPAVNLARVQQAELGVLASTYELRGYTEALLAETEKAYWNFVLAEKEIEIFEQSLAVAKQQLEEVELRIEVGILPEIEAAAARAEVARREQELINARSLLEERRLRLLRLINLPADGRLDYHIEATSSPGLNTGQLSDMPERVSLAEKMRPDLNEARLLLQQDLLETTVTRNGLLPRLDFFIALGQTGYAGTFADSLREIDGENRDFTIGFRLSHFFGKRAAQGRDLAARAARRQAVEAVENLQRIVRLDVRLAVNEAERAREQVSASRTTRMLQEETLKAEKERFDVGASTALQVAQAQRDLVAGYIAEVEAVIGYRIALVNLYLAEGSLLERRGVILD